MDSLAPPAMTAGSSRRDGRTSRSPSPRRLDDFVYPGGKDNLARRLALGPSKEHMPQTAQAIKQIMAPLRRNAANANASLAANKIKELLGDDYRRAAVHDELNSYLEPDLSVRWPPLAPPYSMTDRNPRPPFSVPRSSLHRLSRLVPPSSAARHVHRLTMLL